MKQVRLLSKNMALLIGVAMATFVFFFSGTVPLTDPAITALFFITSAACLILVQEIIAIDLSIPFQKQILFSRIPRKSLLRKNDPLHI